MSGEDDLPMRIMNLVRHICVLVGLMAVIIVWGILTLVVSPTEIVFLLGNWLFPDPEAKHPPSPA